MSASLTLPFTHNYLAGDMGDDQSIGAMGADTLNGGVGSDTADHSTEGGSLHATSL